jgi:cytochrome c nitrite reductase small subunit
VRHVRFTSWLRRLGSQAASSSAPNDVDGAPEAVPLDSPGPAESGAEEGLVEDRRPRRVVPVWVILALAALFGVAAGLGVFTFAYASGPSYLSSNPEACVNCHIMRDQFDAWSRGPHHAVATCSDCHMPHESVVYKYAIKALDGFKHSYAFTTGDFEEPIRITPMDENITRRACLSCHGALTNDINHADTDEPTDCLRCHEGVGHET